MTDRQLVRQEVCHGLCQWVGCLPRFTQQQQQQQQLRLAGVLFIRNEESTAHLKSNLLTVHATQIDEQGPQVLWIKQQQKQFCFYAPHAENKIKIHSLHGRMFVILSCHMNNSIKSIL